MVSVCVDGFNVHHFSILPYLSLRQGRPLTIFCIGPSLIHHPAASAADLPYPSQVLCPREHTVLSGWPLLTPPALGQWRSVLTSPLMKMHRTYAAFLGLCLLPWTYRKSYRPHLLSTLPSILQVLAPVPPLLELWERPSVLTEVGAWDVGWSVINAPEMLQLQGLWQFPCKMVLLVFQSCCGQV